MASIQQTPRSRYFYASFRRPNGRWTLRSTKETDPEKALAIANAWDALPPRGSKEQFIKVAADLFKETFGVDAPGLPTRLKLESAQQFLGQWIRRKEQSTGKSTILAYRTVVGEFLNWLGQRSENPLHQISPETIRAYRDWVSTKASVTTANNRLKILRVIFNDAQIQRVVRTNPAESIPYEKPPATVRRGFLPDELRGLLDAVGDSSWKGVVLAGLYTRQSLRDLVGLEWTAIDLQAGILTLTKGKTGTTVAIPLAPALRIYLQAHCGPSHERGRIWPDLADKAQSGGASVLSQEFYSILVKAGLAPERQAKNIPTGVGRSSKRQLHPLSFASLAATLIPDDLFSRQ